MTPLVKYPWSKLKPGQGFFVPCLDVAKIKQEGLRTALRHRFKQIEATPGIKGGRLGVWFTRRL